MYTPLISGFSNLVNGFSKSGWDTVVGVYDYPGRGRSPRTKSVKPSKRRHTKEQITTKGVSGLRGWYNVKPTYTHTRRGLFTTKGNSFLSVRDGS